MRKIYIFVLIIGIALLISGCVNLSSTNKEPSNNVINPEYTNFNDIDVVEKQLTIGYSDPSSLQNIVKELKGEIVQDFPAIKVAVVNIESGVEKTFELINKKSFNGIRYIEPVYKTELIQPEISDDFDIASISQDTLVDHQWALNILNATEAWNYATGEGVVVAVIDTGVDCGHPDLMSQTVPGYDTYTGNIIMPGDDYSGPDSHGTHVAGIISAKKDNNEGIVGLAYDSKIMPIRVLFEGSGSTLNVALGILWAAEHGADVINMSLGGAGFSKMLDEITSYAIENGVTVVSSSGNDHTDQYYQHPGNIPGVIAVGATDVNDDIVYFSNRGDYLSVGAPGLAILSTVPRNFTNAPWPDGGVNGLPYAYYQGTSMAAPYVAAAAALVKEAYPEASPYQIRKLLEGSAKDIEESGYDTAAGYGRIDPLAALNTSIDNYPAGGNLKINIFDHLGINKEIGSAVSISIINSAGKRYFSKTDMYGETRFNEIDPGVYDVYVGGPDSLDAFAPTWRIEEELFHKETGVLVGNNKTLNINLDSSFSAEIIGEQDKNYQAQLINEYGITVEVLDFIATGTIIIPETALGGQYSLFVSGEQLPLNEELIDNFETGVFNPEWTLGGDATPMIQDTEVSSGTHAVQFGNIGDDQSSFFEREINVPASPEGYTTYLLFDAKISTEANWDFLYVMIDDQTVFTESGELEWDSYRVPVSAGTHTLTFMYEKDSGASEGQDTAWIDEIGLISLKTVEGTVNINGHTIPIFGPVNGIIDDTGMGIPWTLF